MKNSFIDLSNWAHDYLIETRVAMVSLYHQKVTPILHDVVTYVDVNRMEVSLAVAAIALVFLSGILTYNLFKMRSELRTAMHEVQVERNWKNFYNTAFNKRREHLVDAVDKLRERDSEITGLVNELASKDVDIEDLKNKVEDLEFDLTTRIAANGWLDERVGELESKNEELEEEIESLNDQLADANSEAEDWFAKHNEMEAANDDLNEKVVNLTNVVLRAA